MSDLQILSEKLKYNGYEVIICKNKKEANDVIINICKNKIVGTGDSHTLKDLNVLPQILQVAKQLNSCCLDKSWENKHNSIFSEVFISSMNAIAFDTGEMVNIDSCGNRVAGTLYGAKQMIYVIGKNKITPTLEDAICRVRNISAPLNAKCHNYKTPCVITGKCENCNSPDRICRATVIYHKRNKTIPCTVILVNESLGF